MNRIGEIYNKHKGEEAIIICSGPTLHEDMQRMGKGVCIACNYHALSEYKFDYVVAMDGAIKSVPMHKVLKPHYDKFISPYKHFGKYRIDLTAKPTPDHFINTGILSCFVAKQLGCKKVHLCGMDFYQSGTSYFHGDKWVRESNKKPEYKKRCINRLLSIGVDIGFNRLGL